MKKLFTLPYLNEGQMLEGIFIQQDNLMKTYLSKGMIPTYPLDLTIKENQEFIKKLIGWLNEEIAEASDSYSKVIKAYLEERDSVVLIRKGLQDCFIELADSMHFLVELMIFSGIDHSDILAYYEALLTQRNLEPLLTGDGLTTALNYARHNNIFDDPIRVARSLSWKVEFNSTLEFNIKLSEDLLPLVDLDCWSTVKKLLMSGNLLKKRDWTVGEKNMSLEEYHYSLMEAWLSFIKLCDLIGLDNKAIYIFYEQKNLINQDRQRNNY